MFTRDDLNILRLGSLACRLGQQWNRDTHEGQRGEHQLYEGQLWFCFL